MFPRPAATSSVPPAGGPVIVVAERCRRAALAFTNGAEVWTKTELAAWLVGPYRQAARAGTVPPPSPSSPPPRKVEPAAVDDLLADAHVRVLTVLEDVALSRTKTGFARRLLEQHAVQRITSRGQTIGWIPIDAPRMRLAYRVLSLFAADALMRAADYETLTVCHRCERVRFRCLDPACGCTRGDD
jgi:hypothetical protein